MVARDFWLLPGEINQKEKCWTKNLAIALITRRLLQSPVLCMEVTNYMQSTGEEWKRFAFKVNVGSNCLKQHISKSATLMSNADVLRARFPLFFSQFPATYRVIVECLRLPSNQVIYQGDQRNHKEVLSTTSYTSVQLHTHLYNCYLWVTASSLPQTLTNWPENIHFNLATGDYQSVTDCCCEAAGGLKPSFCFCQYFPCFEA